MSKLNQTAINAAVSTLLKAHDKATEALAELLPLLKKTDRVQGRKALLPAVALHYGVATKASESDKNKGEIVMDGDHPKYETAKKQLGRLLNAVYKGTSEKAEIEVPDELLAMMVRMTKRYTRAQVLAAMTGLTFKKA